MITLNQQIKDIFNIHSNSLKSLEKFLTHLYINNKLDEEYSLNDLLKFFSKSKVLELVERRVLLSKSDNFILSFTLINFINDFYNRNPIVETSNEYLSSTRENKTPSLSVFYSQEDSMGEKYLPNSYEETLYLRQLKSLEKNLKIKERDLLDKLINNKVLCKTFGFNTDWLVQYSEKVTCSKTT